jgi:hypothetical protein
MAAEVANSNYCNGGIAYGSSDAVLTFPGKFYLTPQNPSWDAGATSAYLACFDGHKTVYLLGHDCHCDEADYNYNVYAGTANYAPAESPNTEAFFVKTLKAVMTTYNDVDFVRVMPNVGWYCPEDWKYLTNFRQIDFNDFVREIDL